MFAGKLEKLFNKTFTTALGGDSKELLQVKTELTIAEAELELSQRSYEVLLKKSIATGAAHAEAMKINEDQKSQFKELDKKLMFALASNDELVKINRDLVNRVEIMKKDLNTQINFMRSFQEYHNMLTGAVQSLPDKLQSYDNGWLGESKLQPKEPFNEDNYLDSDLVSRGAIMKN